MKKSGTGWHTGKAHGHGHERRSVIMLRPNAYWQLYRKTPKEVRTFFWTVVVFFLIIIIPTAWSYARLYYARTQIPDVYENIPQIGNNQVEKTK
jgi:hypothetical protein